MCDRMPTLQRAQMARIHNVSMALLSNIGIVFNEEEALTIFKDHGFKVDGKVVFFSENQVIKALETVPSRFAVRARNTSKDVIVGEDEFVFVPGYGVPFLALLDGRQRMTTISDHDEFCKLVQTSQAFGMNGLMMVKPSDVPRETVHLDLLFSNLVLCDKPFMVSPGSRREAKDCIDMTAIVWGGANRLRDISPVMVSLISSLSPMQFSKEMAGSLIEMARSNQACIVVSSIVAGSSCPNTLAGVIAMQNAEILAGITLTQLVKAGAPALYGSVSLGMEMTPGEPSIGCLELSRLVSATAQMARFYNLPSQSGGGLTDAHLVDAQAGAESTLALTAAVYNGINLVAHSAGVLGSCTSMNYEMFLLDEEICGSLRKLTRPIKIPDESIDMDMIRPVGIDGCYELRPEAFQTGHTDFYPTELMNRLNHADWWAAGGKRIDQAATDRLSQRLVAYEKPDIDPDIEEKLAAFVSRRKRDYA